MQERLHILALSFLFPNRAQPTYGVFVLRRLQAVSRLGARLEVVSPVQWYPLIERLTGRVGASRIEARERWADLDVHHPRFFVVPKVMKWLDALTYTRAVSRLIARQNTGFDLIDVHWTYPDAFAGWWLAKRHRRKWLVTVRGHEAFYDREWSLRRLIVRWLLRRADRVIALSEELREKCIQLGVPRERTAVVLNGVDTGQFRYMDAAECRARLGLASAGKIILSVGRLTRGKGHDHVIRAAAALRDAGVETDLYIIGGFNPEEDFGGELRRLINTLGLTRVHILDPVPHERLALWYGAADVFCLASDSEGCPNVVLEALACGTPVVVTDVGAVTDIVRPGRNGLLVPRERMFDLTQALAAALEQKWNPQAIAGEMHQMGWDHCARQVIDQYSRAMQGTAQ